MKVVIRTDASIDIGSGHIMRCLVLAEALKEQGHTIGYASRPQLQCGNRFQMSLVPALCSRRRIISDSVCSGQVTLVKGTYVDQPRPLAKSLTVE